MTVQQLKVQVLEFIKKNDLKKALDAFDDAIDNNSDIAKVLAILFGQWKEQKLQELAGLLDFAEKSKFNSQLSNRLMGLSETIDISDLKKSIPICVVCKNEDDKAYMQEFFRRMPLPNAAIHVSKTYSDIANNAKLVIFDNHSVIIPKVEQKCKCEDLIKQHLNIESTPKQEEKPVMSQEDNEHLKLMKDYIGVTDKYIIHFGNFLPFLEQYRDKVHAANSKFALFSRIEEMLDFIDKDRLYLDEIK